MGTKLRFKVGDKVRVNPLEWYYNNKNEEGHIYGLDKEVNFSYEMSHYCGQIFQIQEIENNYYLMHDNAFCWQDWMLEDEAVTKEKQEVNEVLTTEIKDIEEIKVVKRNKIVQASLQPITKEQARNLLVGTKFFCVNYEDAEKLQRKLIECGCEWSDIGEKIDIERWAIFVCGSGFLAHQDKQVVVWCEDSYIPILIDDVLAIKIKEEKPKFDPRTLQPFDKVLVRENDKYKEWFARFFEYYTDGAYYTTSGTSWKYCIPFNEDTKHLHGTINEAPEFYRI